MNLPEGRLVQSRVFDGPGEALAAALERELTGYLVLAPRDTLLLDDEDRGVLTVEDGVPVGAYHPASDRGGPAALAALAVPGPCQCDLYVLPAATLGGVHDDGDHRVPPALPAERLAGDDALAARTRERAPADRPDAPGASTDALAAFLADEERVAAIKEEARREAERSAEEWGLDDHLTE